MHKNSIVAVAAGASAVLAAAAAAATQNYHCTLSSSSSLTQSSELSLPLPGSWIGNYDAAANPGGTRTLPGITGGSGNQAIPFTSTVVADIQVPTTTPTGAFDVAFNATTGALSISNLFIDALADTKGTIATTIFVTFGNWHTIAPNSIYFGVSNFGLPLADGVLSRADATQNGAAATTAASTGANTWSFTINIPVDLMTEGAALGQKFGGTPVSAILVVTGTLTQSGGGIAISSDLSGDESEAIPSIGALAGEPFDMPTIFPPGNTAHLLVSGTFGEGTLSSQVDAHLDAPGVLIPKPGDFNADGTVDGADLGVLLGGWGLPGMTDLNNDGTTDGADLGVLLGNWG